MVSCLALAVGGTVPHHGIAIAGVSSNERRRATMGAISSCGDGPGVLTRLRASPSCDATPRPSDGSDLHAGQVEGGGALREAEHFDADDFVGLVVVEDDVWGDLLEVEDGRDVETEVQRVGLGVDVEFHGFPPLTARTKESRVLVSSYG